MLLEILRAVRRAPTGQVARAGAHLQPHHGQRLGHQGGVRQVADAQRQIEPLFHQRHPSVAVLYLQLQIRVAFTKQRQGGGEVQVAKIHRHRQLEGALGLLVVAGQLAVGLFELRQQRLGALVVELARLGGVDLAGGARQQPGGERLLQLLHQLGGHGDRDAELVGGLGKTLTLHHLDEGAHGGYLVHLSLSVDNYFNKSLIIYVRYGG